jgi:hypothetical protein
MFDNISQGAIFILGTLAIVLVAKKNKWGFVAGFLSQPFWYITAYINEQWGVFFVSFIYTRGSTVVLNVGYQELQ